MACVACPPHPYGGTGSGCGLRAAPVGRHNNKKRVWLVLRAAAVQGHRERVWLARRTRMEAQGAGVACAPHPYGGTRSR